MPGSTLTEVRELRWPVWSRRSKTGPVSQVQELNFVLVPRADAISDSGVINQASKRSWYLNGAFICSEKYTSQVECLYWVVTCLLAAQESHTVNQFYNWKVVFALECGIGMRNELDGLRW